MNGPYFANDIIERIFIDENYCIMSQITFIPKDPVGNKSALFKVIA